MFSSFNFGACSLPYAQYTSRLSGRVLRPTPSIYPACRGVFYALHPVYIPLVGACSMPYTLYISRLSGRVLRFTPCIYPFCRGVFFARHPVYIPLVGACSSSYTQYISRLKPNPSLNFTNICAFSRKHGIMFAEIIFFFFFFFFWIFCGFQEIFSCSISIVLASNKIIIKIKLTRLGTSCVPTFVPCSS